MAIRDIFKVSTKTFLNPKGWLDFDLMRDQTRTVWGVLSVLFSRNKPVREETFEQAMQRLEITEADVQRIAKSYKYYAYSFALLGVLTFLYAFYHLVIRYSLLSWILGLSASGLFLSQAFKYDFWAFQMIHRRLGATFADWKQSYLGKKEKP